MNIRLVRLDNELMDITSIAGGPDEIPGNVRIELRAIMPFVMAKNPDVLFKTEVPFFQRAEATPSLGKLTADSTVSLSQIPPSIQELWRQFEKAVIEWAEQAIHE